MSILYIDGFESSTGLTTVNRIWTVAGGDELVSSNPGYKGGRCLNVSTNAFYSSTTSLSLKKESINGGISSSGIVGFWYYKNMNPSQNSDYAIFGVGNTVESFPGIQIGIKKNTGEVFLYGYASFSINSNTYLLNGQWYHFELKYQILDSITIPCVLRINGMSVVEIPIGTDTRYGSPLYLSVVMYGHKYYNGSFDHLYIANLSGNQDFIGPHVYVQELRPISNGVTNAWDISPSTGNAWDAVNDDADQDDASTIVYTAVSGNRELYGLSAFTGNYQSIFAVQHNAWAMKSGTIHDMALKFSQYQNTTHNSTVPSSGLGVSFLKFINVQETNPITATSWTTGDLCTNGQFGFQLHYTGV
jgi:hypothetical protein